MREGLRVRDVIHNFNADGFDSLHPRYRGGQPPKVTLPQRREVKKLAKSSPAGHGLSKLAEFLVAEGMVDDISHEGLRVLLREEGVTFQGRRTGSRGRLPRGTSQGRRRTARGRLVRGTAR